MAQKTTPVRMDGRVSVITGATSGVGYHAAKWLAKGGARLVLVCRNVEKAARVKGDLNDLNWEKRRYRGLQGYGASKVAQLLTVWELADRLKGTGVTINAMHPGEVRTNMGMNNGLLYHAPLPNCVSIAGAARN